ncbi:latent-transforming growth factor beta-binding protein 4 [Anopheles moucheti]|uniref:latent-transforming growth factor beta-binding protein 4 n=1 Tax=Anopheles moucheti TaxID=186751 RepID=UPI0022F0ADC2|nr:latent-transforming growth factor beta-binding protein 4 [Anopheles moucheti]
MILKRFEKSKQPLLLVLGIIALLQPAYGETIAIEQILSLCCQQGEEWGLQSRTCSSYNESLELVPAGLHGLCLSTIEICCSKQHKIYQCTAGHIAARQGRSCSPKGDQSGSEFYTDCCEACKIGLVVGSSANKCSVEPFTFGSPWDEIYDDCCNDIKKKVGQDEPRLCEQFPTICSQVCENVEDGSYVCKCHPGFELMDDNKTCAPVSDEDNETLERRSCTNGFNYNKHTDECEDVNECETGEARCNSMNQVCRNTRGSFVCVDIIHPDIACDAGYELKDGKCEDINECEEDGACDEGYHCVNIDGSYECIAVVKNYPTPPRKKVETCTPGFRRHNDQCVDIDECAADKNACDSNQVCTNEIGGFRCDCKIGFNLDSVTNACVDINECQVNAHECLETQRCDNTIGSYTCIRLQSCGTGYTLNAETGNCDDDDECALGRHNCRPPFECFNTKGSFRCRQLSRYHTMTSTSTSTSTTTSTTERPSYQGGYGQYPTSRYSSYQPHLPPCGIGFERNAMGACVDIDECARGASCRRHQQCINTNGSYRCRDLLTCPVGYRVNDDITECLDIDECATGDATCGPEQTCKNKKGGYVCVCPPGHMIGRNKRCEDIDECAMHGSKVCQQNANCINTIGSYRCDCKEGFKNGPNEMICTDVDECKEIPGLCHQRCLNYWGSYRCGCHPGYRLSLNNRTCDDVDECEEYKAANLCVGICENTPGSYACRCPQGYKLGADGRSCIDIDECQTGDVCNGRHDICTNIGGSYRCTTIECPYGYRHDSDRRNRCQRNNRYCNTDDMECIRKPHSYSYNFLTIVSNILLPPEGRGLFTLAGPSNFQMIDFDLKLVSVDAAPHVKAVDIHYFGLEKRTNEAQLNLRKSIEGPQDIELELSMSVFQNGELYGTNVARLFLMISAYEY